MNYPRLAHFGSCAALLLLDLLSGCGGGSSSMPINTGAISSAPRIVSNLQFTLTADKSVYKIGEPVQLSFAIKNLSSQPVIAIGGGCNVFY